MINYDKVVGNHLKRIRLEIGLTQSEVAELLDKSLRTVQKYEKGEISISVSTLGYIAQTLETDICEFFQLEEQRHDGTDKQFLFVQLDR
ncbi:helix-turn-helix domain-containing protein [Anaerotignum sp.]|uniref:helix-turn-helix domain-containing protein n=1 Tax=Anaerotignum sp. TaxID=2039241 RepID=UPI0028B1722D|nr:helix-turn-helix transcriptional regulator [Anaerotignum sp.]